ncbi:hypothetical protein AD940_02470 [Gluconobacter thailandicus]|uniref:hypothetical protein n=1 Tax=Gluconobacter thailandicus TaxID=257438 RepID=UPI00077797D2|nr:hypothetical protein [Gluconobacter thailandicus]KXV35507.1 hypothetical protein AD940_02470 [Gluconobacter thailandicus]
MTPLRSVGQISFSAGFNHVVEAQLLVRQVVLPCVKRAMEEVYQEDDTLSHPLEGLTLVLEDTLRRLERAITCFQNRS